MKLVNLGSKFIVGFEETELNSDLQAKLLKIQPAGIIFYDCNIASRDQVRKLIRDLKSLLGEDLLVTVDQEGGRVQRLRTISPNFPSFQELGRSDDDKIRSCARELAEDLVDLGFDLSFTPCVDLKTNPNNPVIDERSFAGDLDSLLRVLKIWLSEYRKSGLKTCAKHFPGHGDTDLDSHLALPQIFSEENRARIASGDLSQDEFAAQHLEPFRAAIDLGVEMVMIAHLICPHLDADLPASLSSRVIQGELRERLGFGGLVCSDEMTMKALAPFADPDNYYASLTRLALEAGNDMLIWNTDLEQPLEALMQRP